MSSKRNSLSKSKKSGKFELDNFLNASIKNKGKNKCYLSTSVEYNPEDSPFEKLFIKPSHPIAQQPRKKIQ
jgi:hypothetical protein